MDSIDKRLLEILSEDARSTSTDIAKIINLSLPATNKRIARLIKSGIIERFTIRVNPKKINQTVHAFIMLIVDQYSKTDTLMDFVNQSKNVVACYAITGEYDYLLDLYAKDIEELESILLKIKKEKALNISRRIRLLNHCLTA